MSEPAPDPIPQARTARSAWPGLVWAIPLSALILVAVLGVRAFVNRGVDVVISFDTAAGIKVGDTKVVYQGYEAGRVVKVDVNRQDVRHVDVTVRLDHRAAPILNTHTIFWLIGVKTSLSDLASVKAAFSGPTIGVAPGVGGAPTRRFRGLGEEPVVLPGTPGTAYVLTAERGGPVKRGSSVSYRGQAIGKVTSAVLTGPRSFRIDIFVLKPFDSLVRPGATFFPASPLQLSLGAGGVQARVEDPASILAGSVQMDLPADAPTTPSPARTTFTLYPTRQAADAGPPGPRTPYRMAFAGAGGDLAEGAPVTLLGFAIGEVTASELAVNPSTGLPFTRVTVGIEPARLKASLPEGTTDPATLRAATDAALTRLLACGYRARLVQSPPLIGAHGVVLERVATLGPARLVPGAMAGEPPLIPAAPAGDDMVQQVSSILGKVDRIPIERIGRDVAAITGRLRTLTASPKLDQSLDHLRNTLARADRITATAEPQVGPLVEKLRQAADEATAAAAAARGLLEGQTNPDASLPRAVQELTDAAASVRALADQLGRHPESLIKGKGKKGP